MSHVSCFLYSWRCLACPTWAIFFILGGVWRIPREPCFVFYRLCPVLQVWADLLFIGSVLCCRSEPIKLFLVETRRSKQSHLFMEVKKRWNIYLNWHFILSIIYKRIKIELTSKERKVCSSWSIFGYSVVKFIFRAGGLLNWIHYWNELFYWIFK